MPKRLGWGSLRRVQSSGFTADRALSLLEGRRAVIVGDMVLDAYVYGETVRVSREAPVLVVRKERTEHRLGGGANTAANLAALGLVAEVVGVVGDDAGGSQLRSMLEARGVRIDHLRVGGVTTPVKTRVLAGAFGTSRQQVLRIDDEPDGSLAAEWVNRLTVDLCERAKGADVVVVSDYGMGLAAQPLLGALATIAESGVPVCVDSRYRLSSFCGVTAVTPNIPESEGFVGHPITSQELVEQAGRRIMESLGCRACLMTQGRGGMTLFLPQAGSSHVDIVGAHEVADVTGAGDTVIATFSAALAAGLGMENGMRLANVAAGVVVGKLGTAEATPAEIAAVVEQHGVGLVPWEA